MERTILFKHSKIQVNAGLKIILLEHQNNNVGNSSVMKNVIKGFSNQFEYPTYFYSPKSFSDLYPAKFLDFNKTLSV